MERKYLGDYIKGNFQLIRDHHGVVQTRNPANLDECVEFPFHFEHVKEAVAVASRTFASWRRIPASDRYTAIRKYRDLMAKRKAELSEVLCWEVGKPVWEAEQEIDETLHLIDYYLEQGAQTIREETVQVAQDGIVGKLRYAPLGVVAVLTPAVEPIAIPHMYLIPALLDGNCVVIKSSKNAPLVGQAIASIAHDCGLAAGSFNLIHGNSEVAHRLITQREVRGIFFNGPYETALKIRKSVVSDLSKLLVLNAGGKNGVIVWDDCDYEKALYETLCAAYLTTGQRCSCTSRVLVHKDLFDRFRQDLHSLSKKLSIGDGFTQGEKSVFMGPLVSEEALENYLRFQGMAVREGCEEVMRGKALERDNRGYFVSPSIHIVEEANPKSLYQTEDNSGPNVALFCIEDLDQAIEILNQPTYGFIASIYSSSRKNYIHLANEVEVGQLYWNLPTIERNPRLPYSGIKISGNYRPLGSWAHAQLSYPLSALEASTPVAWNHLPTTMPRLK